ncbi:hypothetical protein BJ944DRAFT_251658 [Cunninghamella echinulata]|nr:hypothetical protein BJ944DRAFT_251658 [Cunninghamella echinulata]
MSAFPNEIIKIICQHLSHRELLQCMLVNSNWCKMSSAVFYHTLNIYNKKQLDNFIEFATTITTTISKINNLPICNLVNQIIIDDFYKWDHFTQQDLKRLHDTCPNIKLLDGFGPVSAIGKITFSELPNWHQWVQIPRWLTERDQQWYQCIQPINNYQSLEFNISREMIHWKEDDHGNNEKTKNKKGFYLQGWKDHQLQKIKILDYYFRLGSYILQQPRPTIAIENGSHYLYHYSQIITLPTTISYMHLNHIFLNFEEWNRTSTSQLDILKFDERIIESIHEACPVLESLHLRKFNMNLSSQYQTLMKSPPLTTTPYLTLKKLTIEFCFFVYPECFDYLTMKFPNISTLNFYLDHYFTKHDDIKHKFQLAYYKMLSAFQYVSTLSIKSFFWEARQFDEGRGDTLWKDNEFLSWLSSKQHPLKSLTYHRDLAQLMEYDSEINNIEDEYQILVLKQKYSFMDYLQELKLINERLIHKAFINLSFMFNKGIYYSQLITLDIRFTNEQLIEKTHFNFYLWLDLFPNLKKLRIEEDTNMVFNGMDKRNLRIELQKQEQQQNKIYPLQELNIIGVELSLANGLTDIGDACPSLKKLILVDVLISGGYQTQNNTDTIIMYTPHLKLDEFVIANMYTATNKDIPKNIKRSFELIGTESNNKNSNKGQTFTIKLPTLCEKGQVPSWVRIKRRTYDIYDNQDKIYPSIQPKLGI